MLQGLDSDSRAALALIYMRNNALHSPIKLLDSESHALERLGSSLGGCLRALEFLEGSLVHYVNAEGEALWQFRHPTISDAYSRLLIQNPELLGIYVHGSQ